MPWVSQMFPMAFLFLHHEGHGRHIPWPFYFSKGDDEQK